MTVLTTSLNAHWLKSPNSSEGRIYVVDKKQARILKSLLKRTDLTPEERATISELLRDSSSTIEIDLNTVAFTRRGPPPDKIRLCLDFGTAMSKAWATGRRAIETLPLLIGKAAGEDGLTVPSSIYIGADGRIYLGASAERQHRAEVRSGRPRFDNLKRILSEADVGIHLPAFPLREGIDPTESGITGGDLIILYFAWLTDLSEIALASAINATEGKLSIGKSDIRGVARRFAIPCFESADGRQGEARSTWARRIMIDALLRAQLLADSLHGKWDQITVGKLKPLMEKLYEVDIAPLTHLMVEDCAVREPLAAGASRFDTALGDRTEPTDVPIRQYLLVIDAGAGTTDFALFQAITRIGESCPVYGLLRKSVRMSLIAGNEVDAILRPIVLEACGVDPQKLSAEDLAYAKMDLDGQIRDIKRNLFEGKSNTVVLHPTFRGIVNLQSLLSHPKMQRDGVELLNIRKDILSTVFKQEQLDDLRMSLDGGTILIHVLLTGGSGALPMIRDLAQGQITLGGTQIHFELVNKLPDWVDRLPRETARQLAEVYPQCAVAIGGAVPELPKEVHDLELPVTPPPRGTRTLPRNQITGV